jgi:hypothetical protein
MKTGTIFPGAANFVLPCPFVPNIKMIQHAVQNYFLVHAKFLPHFPTSFLVLSHKVFSVKRNKAEYQRVPSSSNKEKTGNPVNNSSVLYS